MRADRPRCLPWSSALLCANSFRPSAEIVTSRGGASSCCPPAPGLADKPQPEANVCLLRRREGGGSGLRRGPRAGSHLSRQPHARQGSGSSSQSLGEWGRLPALKPGRDQGHHPPGRCPPPLPFRAAAGTSLPLPVFVDFYPGWTPSGRLGEEGRQRLGAAAPAQRALLRGLAGLWSPEHSAHTAVPRDEAAAPCAGSRPRPRQCPGRPASWPAASAPVPRLCQFFLRAGPGGCACCEMSGFRAALRPGAGRRRLSSLGRLRIQCVAPAA